MSECDKFGNLIEYPDEHDGIKRSTQACFIIKKYNPQSVKDISNVIQKKKRKENIVGWHLKIFNKSDRLTNFCKKEAEIHEFYNGQIDPTMNESEKKIKKGWNKWYVTECVTYVDESLYEDVWKLSPELNKKYPSLDEMRRELE